MGKSWKSMRREAILAAWPVNAQLEAILDAQEGRPEKLAALRAGIAAIKDEHPKPDEAKKPK